MKFASAGLAALAGLCAAQAYAAQPVILPPYPVLPTVLYDVDYAVSSPAPAGAPGMSADTIISIGLPTSVKTTGCSAQVDWFDWDGTPAGLSGPGAGATGLLTVVPGQTLEYTTSSNGNPNNYPNFQENVFRDSSKAFEGYAQVRIQCPSAVTLAALRVDAEFATSTPSGSTDFPASITTKTINVSKPTGLIGY
jgi:hypothetical protein